MPDHHPRGPEEHKAVAKELGLRGANHLYVMDSESDPFYKGTDRHFRYGRWFAETLRELGYTSGIYIRRVHYRMVSDPGKVFTGPDGRPYLNTVECWRSLVLASGHARILGLVDAEAFVDKRNPDPIIYRRPREFRAFPRWSWRWGEPEPPDWSVPTLRSPHIEPADPFLLPFVPSWELPDVVTWQPEWDGFASVPDGRFEVTGYDYADDDQPVLVEVWVEKSTQNDILGPLCSELHVNLVPALGIQSITAAVNLLRRVKRHGKPAHVLYISDFDPAGESMPINVARQVEFWREEMKIDLDVTLDPLLLSRDQAERYELPRIPIKETDARKAGFEERHGAGAVELDALEAKHPGALARLVRAAVEPYVDRGLRNRLDAARDAADEAIGPQWEDHVSGIVDDLEEVEGNVREQMADYEAWVETRRAALEQDLTAERVALEQIRREMEPALTALTEAYRGRLDAVRSSVNGKLGRHRELIRAELDERTAQMQSHQDRADDLQDAVRHGIRSFEPDLPVRPEPEEPAVDHDGMLFDSARDWLDQLEAYRAAKAGSS